MPLPHIHVFRIDLPHGFGGDGWAKRGDVDDDFVVVMIRVGLSADRRRAVLEDVLTSVELASYDAARSRRRRPLKGAGA